jgi:hypothetical protein
MSLSRILIKCLIASLTLPLILMAAEKLKPEELVSRHLESIGAPEQRSKVTEREIDGTVQMTFLTGGSGLLQGQLRMASVGPKNSARMTFPNTNYQKEAFVFDGTRVMIGHIHPGARSRLGALLDSQPQIVKEGLLGGVLSTAWPLLVAEKFHGKIASDGLKKIDGRELHQLSYNPKKGDMTIKLFFEPGTFHHVMTVYSLVRPPSMVEGGELANARQTAARIVLEERFDEFKPVDGLTLPTKWSIKLTSDGDLNGPTSITSATSIMEWKMDLQKFRAGGDPPPFEAE